ncbi:MAG: thioredoxin [Ruminococcaceae bacterium]|nr:thioredoxin [Oscillospiraceae bacterium]
MAVLTITAENFKTEVLGSAKPVLLDFWATWCPPCMMQSPIVDELAEERSDIVVGKVNTDEQPELSAAFEVENIPTLVIMRGGKVSARLVGLHSKEQILEELK